MSSPFDRVKDIYTSRSTFVADGYVQYVINKELSKNPALIAIVNEVQKYTLTNHQHFIIMNSIAPLTRRPGYARFPWIWHKGGQMATDVTIVAKHYKESENNAQDMLRVLESSETGQEHLQWLRKVYGSDNFDTIAQVKKRKR